ncbi:hypothetical protein WJX81_005890 [Elliptochloris bilobata]|uniref:Uncharacterized protein n=1 Tax=Elliptochloris bilobata TaxID=381761 RepID=A0AAW1RKT2_9CHLO
MLRDARATVAALDAAAERYSGLLNAGGSAGLARASGEGVAATRRPAELGNTGTALALPRATQFARTVARPAPAWGAHFALLAAVRTDAAATAAAALGEEGRGSGAAKLVAIGDAGGRLYLFGPRRERCRACDRRGRGSRAFALTEDSEARTSGSAPVLAAARRRLVVLGLGGGPVAFFEAQLPSIASPASPGDAWFRPALALAALALGFYNLMRVQNRGAMRRGGPRRPLRPGALVDAGVHEDEQVAKGLKDTLDWGAAPEGSWP